LVAHAAAGRLRDLRVDTWALLGIGAVPAAEIVNTCVAFEYAYQGIDGRQISIGNPRDRYP
jgi:hypothetical protein